MKTKTIKQICKGMTKALCKSIAERDKELASQVENNVIITGGAIVSMLLNEEVNDFDIYIRDPIVARKLTEFYINWFQELNPQFVEKLGNANRMTCTSLPDGRVKVFVKSSGAATETVDSTKYNYFEGMDPNSNAAGEYVEDLFSLTGKSGNGPKYRPVIFTSNAIGLSDNVQVITRFVGPPEEIHKNFDFVHCTGYWTSWDNTLCLPPEALESIITRELRYVGSLYPICSIFRMRKFINRGWTINAGQIFKACYQISGLDLENMEVLEDQLTGVDVAYFLEVIQKLKNQERDGKVDSTYLMQLIDEVF